MISILSPGFLSGRKIHRAMRRFAAGFSENDVVLDIGCGTMPYRNYFRSRYIGADPLNNVKPDIVAPAWSIPLADASCDGIVMNQSLEHIAELEATVQEVLRLLKPGGRLIVTAPHTFRDHSHVIPAPEAPVQNFNHTDHPHWRTDYYRFTKFGLLYLFRDLRLRSYTATTGYIGTMMQLCTIFFASLHIPYVFIPLYFINNIIATTADTAIAWLAQLPIPHAQRFYRHSYQSLPMNHIAVFEKTDSILT